MYFWDIKGLKNHLSSTSLSQHESLKYLLVLSFLGIIPLPRPPYFSEGNFLYFSLGAAELICGTIYAYVKNGGAQGQDFLSRYVSLSWVMVVRMLPYILIFGLLLGVGILSKLQESNQKIISLIVIYAIAILYYWRVSQHMADVASEKSSKINLRVE